MLAKDED